MKLGLLGRLLVTAVFVTAGAQAQAALISVDQNTTVGSQYNFQYSLDVGTATLSAEMNLGLVSFENGKVVFDIFVKNTSTTGAVTRFTAFGLDVEPNATGVQLEKAGTVFNTVRLNPSPNMPEQKVDICGFAGGNCPAGNTGLTEGQSDSLQLAIFGDFRNGVTLSGFPIRFTGDFGSHVFNPTTPTGGTPVPEPGALALLGLGLAGLGLAGRRRRNR